MRFYVKFPGGHRALSTQRGGKSSITQGAAAILQGGTTEGQVGCQVKRWWQDVTSLESHVSFEWNFACMIFIRMVGSEGKLVIEVAAVCLVIGNAHPKNQIRIADRNKVLQQLQVRIMPRPRRH